MNNLFNPAVFFKSNERHELAHKIENEIRKQLSAADSSKPVFLETK